MKELNSDLTFFGVYEQRMVAVSGNTGSAPLIGSKVIWEHTSGGSVWSEKGPGIQGPTRNQTQTASCPRQTGHPM